LSEFNTLRAAWPRPWVDSEHADQLAYQKALRQTSADVLLSGAQAWAKVVEHRFLPTLAKWLDGKGWQKPPPKRGVGRGRGRATGRRQHEPDRLSKTFLKLGGWQEDAESGDLIDPATGRVWPGSGRMQ
jgi:hypothetical protein